MPTELSYQRRVSTVDPSDERVFLNYSEVKLTPNLETGPPVSRRSFPFSLILFLSFLSSERPFECRLLFQTPKDGCLSSSQIIYFGLYPSDPKIRTEGDPFSNGRDLESKEWTLDLIDLIPKDVK